MQRAEAELAARRQNRGQTLMELLERFVAAWEAEQARKAETAAGPGMGPQTLRDNGALEGAQA